jgi:hypothetical protein
VRGEKVGDVECAGWPDVGVVGILWVDFGDDACINCSRRWPMPMRSVGNNLYIHVRLGNDRYDGPDKSLW